jgi:uncharacterized protein (TIGR02391 family)
VVQKPGSTITIDIGELLSNVELLSKVRDDFYANEFESAILKAFKMIEESIRLKTGQPTAYGLDLIKIAFVPANAILKHSGAQTSAETEALFALFRGAFGWFRNPASHRTVTYADAHQAAQVLVFANLLLGMIDECTT